MMANKEVRRRRGRWREHEKPCSVISIQLWNIRYGTFRTFMLIVSCSSVLKGAGNPEQRRRQEEASLWLHSNHR